MKLVEAGNMHNLAYHLIINDGFTIDDIGIDESDYIVKKADVVIKSKDILSVLGMSQLPNFSVEDFHRSEFIDDNILISCNELIKLKYNIKINNQYSDDWFDWVATKKDIELIADTPIKLFGLHVIYEKYGNDYRNQKIPNYFKSK